VLGELLPIAVGVAISPIPIIATILMLLSPRAARTSLGFLLGWVGGIVTVTTVFTVLAATVGLGGSDGATFGTSWVGVLVGVLLLVLAVRRWRARPGGGEAAELPAWLAAIDSITFAKAVGLAFVLAAVNPKNVLLCAAAGATIGGASLSGTQRLIAITLYTALGACTVVGPVVAYAVAGDRMSAPLESLKAWLQANNATVMTFLLLVFGVVVLGQGLGAL
jgi:hypothetical protein